MNFYQQEILRIRAACYANTAQLRTVIHTRKFLNDHLDQELNLDILSRTGLTSKFHLLRLFKKYYGQTPQQYLRDQRIQKAKQYLKEGKSVTETCFAVGFGCPSSFSTLFRRKTGLPPAAFQKKQFSQSKLPAG